MTGLSPAAARKRIERLDHAPGQPAAERRRGPGLSAVAECDRPVHVVYVLTDLARPRGTSAGRPRGSTRSPRSRRARARKIATFVLRLTPEEIHNVAVDRGRAVVDRGDPGRAGRDPGPDPVGGTAGDPDGRVLPRRREEGREDRSVPAGSRSRSASRPRPRLKDGELHRGEIVLSGTPDPLEFDDKRYFTFKVRPPLKVLVISDRPERRRVRRSPPSIRIPRLEPTIEPGREGSVLRLQPPRTGRRSRTTPASSCSTSRSSSDEDWGTLNGYVHEGGGWSWVLGNRCDPANYNESIAAQLLPAQLDRARPPRPRPPSARSPTSPIRCSRGTARI